MSDSATWVAVGLAIGAASLALVAALVVLLVVVRGRRSFLRGGRATPPGLARRSSSARTRPSTRRRKPARVRSWPPTKSLSRASYLDQPATGGLPASDGLFDLREEAGGVRFEVRIQKVTRRSPRAGLICAFCRDFVLLRTSHFPPHLPVEHVDNSGCASAARSGRRVRCGEGASVRKALAGWDPLFGGGPARSPQRAGFSSKT